MKFGWRVFFIAMGFLLLLLVVAGLVSLDHPEMGQRLTSVRLPTTIVEGISYVLALVVWIIPLLIIWSFYWIFHPEQWGQFGGLAAFVFCIGLVILVGVAGLLSRKRRNDQA